MFSFSFHHSLSFHNSPIVSPFLRLPCIGLPAFISTDTLRVPHLHSERCIYLAFLEHFCSSVQSGLLTAAFFGYDFLFFVMTYFFFPSSDLTEIDL